MKIKPTPKIKPCPFCGKAPRVIREEAFSEIECENKNCPVLHVFAPWDNAVRIWNKRSK